MSNGRYFIRVSDETRRLLPDDLSRLMAEKNSFVWELQTTRRIPAPAGDEAKLADFARRVRASDRVSEFVRGKADAELLEHYLFVRSGWLTNLGILWIGRRCSMRRKFSASSMMSEGARCASRSGMISV